MPAFPFTDTHVHFYDFNLADLTWSWLLPEAVDSELGDYDAIKSRRYVAEDFLSETRFHNVSRVVHVQAAIGSPDPVLETDWLQQSASRTGVPQGIVAYADLASPLVQTILDGHSAFPNIRGIRDPRYDDYLLDKSWQRGFALLEEYGLVYCDDPLLEHMPALARLADQHPGITICIDHAGFPRERTPEYFNEWLAMMRVLATRGNTVVKISGLGMGDHNWTVDSLRPWVMACIELWGPNRAFFGTNWPVDRLYSSYGDIVSAYADLVSGLAERDQEALFAGTADRVFRLQ